MFDINKHRHALFYSPATVIGGLVPDDLCGALAERVNIMINQQKRSVVYNDYERHDTYCHEAFDNFVYYGITPKTLA